MSVAPRREFAQMGNSEFVLRPARLREGRLVLDRDGQRVVLEWGALIRRFSPARTRLGVMILKSARPGMFVGTREKNGVVTTFSFDAAGRSRSIAHVLRQDPAFESSVVEVFLVDNVKWNTELQELGVA